MSLKDNRINKILQSHSCLLKEYKETKEELDKVKRDLNLLQHNVLKGLQGGKTGEYYHLTKEVYDLVNSTDLKDTIEGFKRFMSNVDDTTDDRQLIDVENKLNKKIGTW